MLRNLTPLSAQAAGDGVSGTLITKGWQALFCVLFAICVTGLVLSACSRGKKSSSNQNLSKRVVKLGQRVPKGGGRYKVGNPYKIGGRTYTPTEQPGYDRVGVASWYGEMFHGRYTANGEVYDMNALTAAHPTLPIPTYARVTNLKNGRQIVVRVNDRGPYAHDRIIDMSRRSAQALGFQRNGTTKVRVQYLGRAPLDGNDSLERRVYANQPWARHASLKKPGERKKSRTQLALAVQEEMQSDQMVVGSIPREEAPSLPEAKWETSTKTTPTPMIPRSGRKHFVQAASFQNREFAETLNQKLASLGPAEVLQANVSGKTWYRVRLGPFNERHSADEALRAVVSSGSSDARIVGN
jgi:rare lipoprotein A